MLRSTSKLSEVSPHQVGAKRFVRSLRPPAYNSHHAAMGWKSFWKSRLLSSLRTGVACLIAALLLQYAHGYMQWASFPVFSFILALTLVGESSFGNGLRNAFSAVIGGLQGLILGMLGLSLLGPSIPLWTCIASIFLTCLVIGYPSFTTLLTKRISLTIAAHLHVVAYSKQQNMERVFYPLRLGCTTMLGITCGVIALAFPVPRFATIKVKEQIIHSIEVISKAFDVVVDAFCTQDRCKSQLLRYQAKSLVEAGSQIVSNLCDIHMVESEVELQCLPLPTARVFDSFGKRLIKFMLHLKAMEKSSQALQPSGMKDLLNDSITQVRDWSNLALSLIRVKSSKHSKKASLVVTDEGNEIMNNLDESIKIALATATTGNLEQDATENQISSMYFFYNMKLFVSEVMSTLHGLYGTPSAILKIPNAVMVPDGEFASDNSTHLKSTEDDDQQICEMCRKEHKEAISTPKQGHTWFLQFIKLDVKRAIISFKISLAMAVGALLGILYDKNHSIWATIIIGMAFKDASFKISNIRLQGVVLGTIYGYLLSLVTHQHPIFSVVALAPWVIFTSFMRYSKSYEYMGSISALIGAIFLLGHRHKVPLNDFAIGRIIETFLGLTSFVLVELLVYPRKAISLAKEKLIRSLGKVQQCLVLASSTCQICENCHASILEDMKESTSQLSSMLIELTALINEAKLEPYSWNQPFQEKIYTKLTSSQGRILDLYQFFIVCCSDLRTKEVMSSDRVTRKCRKILEEPLKGLCNLSTTLDSVQQRLLLEPSQRLAQEKDLESQGKDVHAIAEVQSTLLAATLNKKYEEILSYCGDDHRIVVLPFGALIFCIRALTMEISKVEKNIVKLLSTSL